MIPIRRIPAFSVLLLLLASCGSEPVHRTIRTADPPLGAVAGCYLAATVPWEDERRDIPVHLVDSADGVQIVRLDEVHLPRKMVSVGGQYPGDEGYPLVEWTVARHPRTARPDRTALIAGPPSMMSPEYTTIAAVGDIMPGRGFDTLLMGRNGVVEAVGDVAPLLSAPDILIGNLETAVTDHAVTVPKSYNFKVPAGTLKALTDLGFDYYHLANNHGWDYGETGFLDTLAALDELGAGYSGAGVDLEASRFAWEAGIPDAPAIRILSVGAYYAERNGFDGAVRASSGPDKPGVLWDTPANEPWIREILGRQDGFTILVVHGGYEWESVPRDDVKTLYRRYIDWGADLVVAHHPHVLQGMELYNGVPIAYSLGNFVFPGMKGWSTGEETGILNLRLLEGRIVSLEFLPVLINDTVIRRADGSGIDTRFWRMSRDLTEADGN